MNILDKIVDSVGVKPYFRTRRGILFQGDGREIVKKFPKDCIDCIVTSPPYFNLRNYDKTKTINNNEIGLEGDILSYIKNLAAIFNRGKHYLKKTGALWINIGDKYSDEGSLMQVPFYLSIFLQNSGWLLRNNVIWLKKTCRPESVDNRFTNNYEYFFFFVKNKVYYFKKIYERVSISSIKKSFNDAYKFAKDGDIGRKYSTLNLSKGEEGDRDSLSSGKYAKTTALKMLHLGKNKRSVWEANTATNEYGDHPAMYSQELIMPVIESTCPEDICMSCGCNINYKTVNHITRKDKKDTIDKYSYEKVYCTCKKGFRPGVVFDPFMGSGTTALTAEKMNRYWVGTELYKNYCDLIIDKLKTQAELDQGRLF